MTATTVVLVRHGRTASHAANRYLGRLDEPIDACGERQAETLADWAAGQGFDRLVCSPLARARATAAPIAARTGLAVEVDGRLAELDFGVAEGRTLDELRSMDPAMVERFLADPAAGHFTGGEDPAVAAERGLAAIEAAVAADPGGRILVVAHNTLIRLVTCAVLGVSLRHYRRRLPRIDPAAAVTLLFRDGAPAALLSFNVPHGGDCEDAREDGVPPGRSGATAPPGPDPWP